MQQTGLQNRFPQSVQLAWLWWHDCLVCGKNGWDALHHIFSPSVRHFVKGEQHNKSVLNSCPIHNYGCHIGNEPLLHEASNIGFLLGNVVEALTFQQYRPDPEELRRDVAFVEHYGHLYRQKHRKMVESIVRGDSREPIFNNVKQTTMSEEQKKEDEQQENQGENQQAADENAENQENGGGEAQA